MDFSFKNKNKNNIKKLKTKREKTITSISNYYSNNNNNFLSNREKKKRRKTTNVRITKNMCIAFKAINTYVFDDHNPFSDLCIVRFFSSTDSEVSFDFFFVMNPKLTLCGSSSILFLSNFHFLT